jgi:hypothetical protein
MFRFVSVLLALFTAATSARAQYVPPMLPAPAPSLIDDQLHAWSPALEDWDVGLNYRFREEDKLGAGFTHAGSNYDFSSKPVGENNDNYQLSRLMPRIGYTSDWFAATVEARSSYSFGDNRYNPTAAGYGLTEDNGPFELQQAYIMLGNLKEFPLTLKVGRQELVYGEQRLIGNFLWNNDARTFDAVKIRYQDSFFGVDLFTSRVVYNHFDHFNQSDPHDTFSGAYFDFPGLSQRIVTETYLLARNVSREAVTDNWSQVPAPFRFPAPEDIYTAGFRIKSKPSAFGPWDFGLEAMYQFGNRTAVFPATTVAAALAAPRLDQHAWAFIAQGGYTLTECPWKPRLALIVSGASGDKNLNDHSSETFQNLFPTNHQLYGTMDLSSLQNLIDYRLALSMKPTKSTCFALEVHQQYLESTDDYWYNVAGVPRNTPGAAAGSGKGFGLNPTYSPDLGQEADLIGGWSPVKWLCLEAGYGHYFRGEYIKQSFSVVGSKDANYFYAQTTFNF